MQISFLTAITSLLAVASATPARKLFARHEECQYSGITGKVRYKGTCTKAGNHGAGVCAFRELAGTYGCDYQWKNDMSHSPCGNAADSQFACKKDGDACYAYTYDGGSINDAVIHCTNV
ncbi:hypothetical protein F5Y05DRAFT_420461 [Hypoxylon sp. FL0543]|nr:hypothetical protein F5Y05DRAFT_420461 [Hypoxylon sp. FL0543]